MGTKNGPTGLYNEVHFRIPSTTFPWLRLQSKLSLPRAPAVLLRSGSLLALGSASQWRESESLSLSVSGVNLSPTSGQQVQASAPSGVTFPVVGWPNLAGPNFQGRRAR